MRNGPHPETTRMSELDSDQQDSAQVAALAASQVHPDSALPSRPDYAALPSPSGVDLDKLEALARAATRGPWKRSNRPNGPFWHISSEYTIGGEPCKSGRQSIGAIHAENKRGAPKYAAMFEANANFVAEFNPATALALIAQARAAQPDTTASASECKNEACEGGYIYSTAHTLRAPCPDCFGRAAQPESATGTTGASIDTPEFRKMLCVVVAPPGWNERLIAHIDAIIGDLRAQLAAKGQGDEPLCPACQGSGEGLMMEGAGPDTYEVPCNCPCCGGSGGLLDAYHGLVKLLAAEREKYLQACGKLFHASLAAPASAQPDRGAAQGDTTDAERKAFGDYFCMTLSCDESESEELIDACRMAAEDAWMERARRAAPAYPASQPVAPEAVHAQQEAPAELCIGVSNNDEGVHINVMQRHADGSTTVLHSAKCPKGGSFGRFTVAAVAPSDAKGKADGATLEYRTCCEHPDCTTCAGRGGFYRIGAKGKADAANAGVVGTVLSADSVYALADEHCNGRVAVSGAYLFKPIALTKFAAAIQNAQSPATSAADAKNAAQDFARGAIAALAVMTSHGHPHGSTYHDDIVRTVGEKVIYSVAEDDDYAWAGLNPRKKPKRAAMAAAPSSAAGKEGGEA